MWMNIQVVQFICMSRMDEVIEADRGLVVAREKIGSTLKSVQAW